VIFQVCLVMDVSLANPVGVCAADPVAGWSETIGCSRKADQRFEYCAPVRKRPIGRAYFKAVHAGEAVPPPEVRVYVCPHTERSAQSHKAAERRSTGGIPCGF